MTACVTLLLSLLHMQAAPAPLPAAEQQELERALAADSSGGSAVAASPSAPVDAAGASAAQPSPQWNLPPSFQPSVQPSVQPSFQSMAPDLSLILDVAAAAFSRDQPLQGGGHDPVTNGFNLQQVELSLNKTVDPYFRLDSFIVFGKDGVEVEEAYATTLALPGNLQVRAGQFLTRFGRLNASHPHTWDFVDQPFVMSRLWGGDGNRGLGVEVSYLAPLPWYVELVASSNQAVGATTARSFYGDVDRGVHSWADFENLLSLKQFFALSENWSLMAGLSGAFGPNGTGPDHRTEIYGADLYVKYRPITASGYTTVAWQSEWFLRRRQGTTETLHDTGGYSYVLWRFAKRWTSAVRFEYGSPSWDGAGHVVGDDLDPTWLDNRERWSANLTFLPTEFSRLRVQGSLDRPQWLPTPTWAAFLAAEFVIGAHGAHAF